MLNCDVIIVGGGPGGASAAWRLKELGFDCLLLERQLHPRLKLCAGWITTDVVKDLNFDIASYPYNFVTFERINATFYFKRSVRERALQTRQHSIRRYQFDHWLLERSGVEVRQHVVKDIRREGGRYILDGSYSCRYLIGAGGTFCPVFRTIFEGLNPRSKEYQIGALEEEFSYNYSDPNCRLWFGENGLVGYSWYVPKGSGNHGLHDPTANSAGNSVANSTGSSVGDKVGNGVKNGDGGQKWINVGIGGWSDYMGNSSISLRQHWDYFTKKLERLGLVQGYSYKPKGHTYYLRQPLKVVEHQNAFLVGDAAGLATQDLAEGIGPAIESGLRAANAIANSQPYSIASINRYSLFQPGLVNKLLNGLLNRRGNFFANRFYARNWQAKERITKERIAKEEAALQKAAS